MQVFVRSSPPNWTSPWQRRPQRSSTGSGFCINTNRRQAGGIWTWGLGGIQSNKKFKGWEWEREVLYLIVIDIIMMWSIFLPENLKLRFDFSPSWGHLETHPHEWTQKCTGFDQRTCGGGCGCLAQKIVDAFGSDAWMIQKAAFINFASRSQSNHLIWPFWQQSEDSKESENLSSSSLSSSSTFSLVSPKWLAQVMVRVRRYGHAARYAAKVQHMIVEECVFKLISSRTVPLSLAWIAWRDTHVWIQFNLHR